MIQVNWSKEYTYRLFEVGDSVIAIYFFFHHVWGFSMWSWYCDVVLCFVFVKDKQRYILFSLFDSVKDQIKKFVFLRPKTINKVILSPA